MNHFSKWISTRNWCLQNPQKLAAIVTPIGVFEIKFVPVKKIEMPIASYEFSMDDE